MSLLQIELEMLKMKNLLSLIERLIKYVQN